jgi:hypothetical protein
MYCYYSLMENIKQPDLNHSQYFCINITYSLEELCTLYSKLPDALVVGGQRSGEFTY